MSRRNIPVRTLTDPWVAAGLAIALSWAMATAARAAEGEIDLAARVAPVRFSAQRVEMPDGVGLAADLYLPTDEGRYPAILLPTPYNSRQSEVNFDRGRPLALGGYAVVYLNVRGQFGSEGRFSPFIDEIPDLVATVEWIVGQEWSDGRIGLAGSSSQSYSNQHLASTGHPAIRALVNWSGLTDPQEVFFPGGAFRLNTLFPWMQFFYWKQPIRSLEEWDRRFRVRPMAENFPWGVDRMRRMAAAEVDVEAIEVPVLQITGWNDVVYRQTLGFYSRMRARGADAPGQRLVVGPWMHNQIGSGESRAGDEEYGAAAGLGGEELFEWVLAWFDRYVKGERNNVEEWPAARLFVMGANEWIEGEAWPPAGAVERTLFLSAGSGGSEGGLTAAAPTTPGTSRFVFDPNDPVPTHGGVNSHIFPQFAGPRDQSRFDERTDILRFVGEPADEAYRLVGPIRAELYVQSSAPDTDFTAKLIELRSDGYSRIIEDGILRARYRDARDKPTWMTPGRVYRVEIDLGATAIEIGEGSRLRLDVSSSNFPKYDLNPNTGEDPFEAVEFVEATQTIHHSPDHASRLIVTLLEPDS